MLQWEQLEHSAILSTFIKLPFVIKIFVCLFLSGGFTQVFCTHLKVFRRIEVFINVDAIIKLIGHDKQIICKSNCDCYVIHKFKNLF